MQGDDVRISLAGTVTGIFALGAVIAAFPAAHLACLCRRPSKIVALRRQVISFVVDTLGRRGCMILGPKLSKIATGTN